MQMNLSIYQRQFPSKRPAFRQVLFEQIIEIPFAADFPVQGYLRTFNPHSGNGFNNTPGPQKTQRVDLYGCFGNLGDNPPLAIKHFRICEGHHVPCR